MHGVHHPQIGKALMGDLLADKVGGHHAGHMPPGGQGRVGDCAHQSHLAAAVDQGQPRLGDLGSTAHRFFQERGIGSGRRPAVDADALQGGLERGGGERAAPIGRINRPVTDAGLVEKPRLQSDHGPSRRLAGRRLVPGGDSILGGLRRHGERHGQVVQYS